MNKKLVNKRILLSNNFLKFNLERGEYEGDADQQAPDHSQGYCHASPDLSQGECDASRGRGRGYAGQHGLRRPGPAQGLSLKLII